MTLHKIFAPTTTKVNLHTKPEINEKIKSETECNVDQFQGKSENQIRARIDELNYEWDTERVLEINFAIIVLISLFLAYFIHSMWLILAGIAAVFMIQHTLQGWCPPLPIIRRIGIRTTTEIFKEKEELKKL